MKTIILFLLVVAWLNFSAEALAAGVRIVISSAVGTIGII